MTSQQLNNLLRDEIDYDSEEKSFIYDPIKIGKMVKDYIQASGDKKVEDTTVIDVSIFLTEANDAFIVKVIMEANIDGSEGAVVVERTIAA